MTDYAKPTAPDEALDLAAESLKAFEDEYANEGSVALAKEQAIRDIRMELQKDARRYREHQPKPDPSPAEQDPVELALHGLLNAVCRIHQNWDGPDQGRAAREKLSSGLWAAEDALRGAIIERDKP